MGKDYYQTLGVDENADAEKIKRSYRNLAKKYHPDANRGDKNAEARFKDISEAYSVLGNEDKRKQYDQMRKFGGAFGPGTGRGFDFSNVDLNDLGKFWNAQNTGQRRRSGFSFEDLFGSRGFGLGDIFGDIFDRGSNIRREKWGKKHKGNTLQSELTIPFDVSIKGGKQLIDITREVNCTSCDGTGAKHGTKPENCPTCKGVGTISMSQGFFSVNRPCPNCYGKGFVIKEFCPLCNGDGSIKKTKRLAVNIPPGIADGSQLKLKGQGSPGTKGGEAGDVFITIRVKPHRFFKRKNNDIYAEVPIDIIKAAKGTKIRIRNIYGKKIELRIPPNTRDSKMMKLNGLGVKTKKEIGDFYITIKVNKRSNLTDEEKEIVEQYENNSKN